MKNLFRLVKKNMKLLIRSRASALIVVLGPLLIIFLAGMAFDNTNTYSISLGTFSQSYNALTESFITELGENQFKVTKFSEEDECVNAIKDGTIHSCIVFSPDFKMGQDMNNDITFYVDYSKVNLVYMVLDTITDSIGEKSSELSLNMTTVLLNTIDLTKKEITEKKSTIITLTSKNDEMGKKVSDTYEKLSSLDISTDLATAAVTNLTSGKNKVSSQIDDLEEIADSALSEAGSLIEDIESEIESSSLTESEKASILSTLNQSKDEIEDLEDDFEDTTNLTSKNIEELDNAISGITTSIADAKYKLEEAAEAKTESLNNLGNVKSLLGEAISNIAALQNSMDTIEQGINTIQVTDPSSIVSPVRTTIKPVVAQKTHLNYIFPVLIVLVVMFTGILLSTTLIMLEKKTTAYFRNFISPTKDITFISATFLTCFILLMVQVVIIIGLSTIFFGPQILYSLHKALPVMVLCITMFILAGMVVGYAFNSEETATLGAISLGSLFLLLSDVILPLESMPQYIFDIAQYNPFVLGSSLLRKAIIYNVQFSSIETGVVYLLAYCAAVFVVVLIIQNFTKKHYFSRYLHKIAAKPEEEKKTNK
ncbi:ABC transporter permease [Candidatus Woesearchaeota archaeon]|nr:ABC transporter permease [Candidatus Woesearchaeota archaeon]